MKGTPRDISYSSVNIIIWSFKNYQMICDDISLNINMSHSANSCKEIGWLSELKSISRSRDSFILKNILKVCIFQIYQLFQTAFFPIYSIWTIQPTHTKKQEFTKLVVTTEKQFTFHRPLQLKIYWRCAFSKFTSFFKHHFLLFPLNWLICL